jgi:hypothetical protein
MSIAGLPVDPMVASKMMEMNQLAHFLNDNEGAGAGQLLERLGLVQAYEYIANGATLMILALLLGISGVILASLALAEHFGSTTEYSDAVVLLIVMAIDLGVAYLMYELGNWLINRSIEAVELKEFNEMQREHEQQMQQLEIDLYAGTQVEDGEDEYDEDDDMMSRDRSDTNQSVAESLSATEMEALHETTGDLFSGKANLVKRKEGFRKNRRGSMPLPEAGSDIGEPPVPVTGSGSGNRRGSTAANKRGSIVNKRGSIVGQNTDNTPETHDSLKQKRKSAKRGSTQMDMGDIAMDLIRTNTGGGVGRKPSHNSSQFIQGLHLLGRVTGQDTRNLDRAGALMADEQTNAVLNSALETLLGVQLPPQEDGGKDPRRGSMFGAIQETICEGLLNMCQGQLRNMNSTGLSMRARRRARHKTKRNKGGESAAAVAMSDPSGENTEDEDQSGSSRRSRRRRGPTVIWHARWCVLTQTHLQIFKDARKPRTIMERPLLAISTTQIYKVAKIKLTKMEQPSVELMAGLTPSKSTDSTGSEGKKGRSSFGGKKSFKVKNQKRSVGRVARRDRSREEPHTHCFQVLTEPFSGYFNFCADTVGLRDKWERSLLHASMDQKMQEKEQRTRYGEEKRGGRGRSGSVESVNGEDDDSDTPQVRQRKASSPQASFDAANDGSTGPIGLDDLTQQLEGAPGGSVDIASDGTELKNDAESLARAMVTVRAAEKKLEFHSDRRLTMQVETVVVHAGYLAKRSKKMKRWQRRFFELRGHFLSYYKERHHDSKGMLNLDDLVLVQLIR